MEPEQDKQRNRSVVNSVPSIERSIGSVDINRIEQEFKAELANTQSLKGNFPKYHNAGDKKASIPADEGDYSTLSFQPSAEHVGKQKLKNLSVERGHLTTKNKVVLEQRRKQTNQTTITKTNGDSSLLTSDFARDSSIITGKHNFPINSGARASSLMLNIKGNQSVLNKQQQSKNRLKNQQLQNNMFPKDPKSLDSDKAFKTPRQRLQGNRKTTSVDYGTNNKNPDSSYKDLESFEAREHSVAYMSNLNPSTQQMNMSGRDSELHQTDRSNLEHIRPMPDLKDKVTVDKRNSLQSTKIYESFDNSKPPTTSTIQLAPQSNSLAPGDKAQSAFVLPQVVSEHKNTTQNHFSGVHIRQQLSPADVCHLGYNHIKFKKMKKGNQVLTHATSSLVRTNGYGSTIQSGKRSVPDCEMKHLHSQYSSVQQANMIIDLKKQNHKYSLLETSPKQIQSDFQNVTQPSFTKPSKLLFHASPLQQHQSQLRQQFAKHSKEQEQKQQAEHEKQRIEKVSQAIDQKELQVQDHETKEGIVDFTQITDLIKQYQKSVTQVAVHPFAANHKLPYSQQLQAFLNRVCVGLDHSVKLAKKTYYTSINLEQKEQNILKKRIAELELENNDLKEEMKLKLEHRNFTEAELEKQMADFIVEDNEALLQNALEVQGAAKYSNTDKVLDEMSILSDQMRKIALQQRLRVSLDDLSLVQDQKHMIEEVREGEAAEINKVQVKTAKKMIKRFYKYTVTADAETQTYDNFIESLKEEIAKKLELITEQIEQISDLKADKERIINQFADHKALYQKLSHKLEEAHDEIKSLEKKVENEEKNVTQRNYIIEDLQEQLKESKLKQMTSSEQDFYDKVKRQKDFPEVGVQYPSRRQSEASRKSSNRGRSQNGHSDLSGTHMSSKQKTTGPDGRLLTTSGEGIPADGESHASFFGNSKEKEFNAKLDELKQKISEKRTITMLDIEFLTASESNKEVLAAQEAKMAATMDKIAEMERTALSLKEQNESDRLSNLNSLIGLRKEEDSLRAKFQAEAEQAARQKVESDLRMKEMTWEEVKSRQQLKIDALEAKISKLTRELTSKDNASNKDSRIDSTQQLEDGSQPSIMPLLNNRFARNSIGGGSIQNTNSSPKVQHSKHQSQQYRNNPTKHSKSQDKNLLDPNNRQSFERQRDQSKESINIDEQVHNTSYKRGRNAIQNTKSKQSRNSQGSHPSMKSKTSTKSIGRKQKKISLSNVNMIANKLNQDYDYDQADKSEQQFNQEKGFAKNSMPTASKATLKLESSSKATSMQKLFNDNSKKTLDSVDNKPAKTFQPIGRKSKIIPLKVQPVDTLNSRDPSTLQLQDPSNHNLTSVTFQKDQDDKINYQVQYVQHEISLPEKPPTVPEGPVLVNGVVQSREHEVDGNRLNTAYSQYLQSESASKTPQSTTQQDLMTYNQYFGNRSKKQTPTHAKADEINDKLTNYQDLIHKAYSPTNNANQIVLEQAKETLDNTEFKLLMLMLQMRGQYSSSGQPMVSKGLQTDFVSINLNSSRKRTSVSAVNTQCQTDLAGPVSQPVVMNDFEQQVNEKQLDIVQEREKAYLKNIQRLYASIQGDAYYKAGNTFSPYPQSISSNYNLQDQSTVRQTTQKHTSNNDKLTLVHLPTKSNKSGQSPMSKRNSPHFVKQRVNTQTSVKTTDVMMTDRPKLSTQMISQNELDKSASVQHFQGYSNIKPANFKFQNNSMDPSHTSGDYQKHSSNPASKQMTIKDQLNLQSALTSQHQSQRHLK